jgi:hypothetical protein
MKQGGKHQSADQVRQVCHALAAVPAEGNVAAALIASTLIEQPSRRLLHGSCAAVPAIDLMGKAVLQKHR